MEAFCAMGWFASANDRLRRPRPHDVIRFCLLITHPPNIAAHPLAGYAANVLFICMYPATAMCPSLYNVTIIVGFTSQVILTNYARIPGLCGRVWDQHTHPADLPGSRVAVFKRLKDNNPVMNPPIRARFPQLPPLAWNDRLTHCDPGSWDRNEPPQTAPITRLAFILRLPLLPSASILYHVAIRVILRFLSTAVL